MKTLYKYYIELQQNKTIKAEVKEYELVAETQEQYVYKNNERFYIHDKLDFITKKPSNVITGYNEGIAAVGILPYYFAVAYTTEKSDKVQAELIEELKKEIEKRSFIDADFLKGIEFKEGQAQ